MSVSGIMAFATNGVYGKDGRLPWTDDFPQEDLSRDLTRFIRVTKNAIVIMGSGTWEAEDTPKPLPNRINIIVTNTPEHFDKYEIDGRVDEVWFSEYLESNIKRIMVRYPDRDIVVIGGGGILMEFITRGILDVMYMTVFAESADGDNKLNLDSITNYMKRSVSTYTKYGTEFCTLIRKIDNE